MRNVTARIFSDEFSCDGIEVIRVVGREQISRPYEFEVDLVLRDANASVAAQMLGSSAELGFSVEGAVERVFQGMISWVRESLDPVSALRTCRVRLVPILNRLAQVSLQAVFTGSIPKIVAEKLSACEIAYELRLSGTYPDRDYVAQFAETDLAFVCRLCEHLGISYFFEGDSGAERVIFTDDNRFGEGPTPLVIPFRMRGETMDVYKLDVALTLTPSLYVVTDYNYRSPQVSIVGRAENPEGTGGGIVEYGVHTKTPEEADTLARLRGEELECRREQLLGESDRVELGAGVAFTLQDLPFLVEPSLLVTAVEHRIEQAAMGAADGALAYSNQFRAISSKKPYRPERLTPVPKIAGFRGGIVVAQRGTDGTSPWLDEVGRYHIQLFFDTLETGGAEPAARAMRMIQAHAGADYGMHFPLRPGTEVMVGFVNGDIDRPVIVGAVPNPLTLSPVTAEAALHSRIRTASGVTVEFEDGF